jgi:hypothetical protein
MQIPFRVCYVERGRLNPWLLPFGLFLSLATSCGYSAPLTFPPGAVCTPYTGTLAFPATLPSPPAPTITTVTGLPATLTAAITPTGATITGTPAWNEFGTWTGSATGTVPAAPWYKKSWSGTGSLTIATPAMVLAPTTSTIPAFSQTSNTVNLTVTPPCAYTVTYTFSGQPRGQRFSLVPASPFDTSAGGTISLVAAAETDVPGSTTVTFKITSLAPGSTPATVTGTITK